MNSRQQIGALLEARGWVPEKRTEKTGQPKIDDELLETIPSSIPSSPAWPNTTRSAAGSGNSPNGKQAWCRHVGPDGRIHGGLVHIGTPHSRAKHLSPNLAQVPNPKKGKPFAPNAAHYFGRQTAGCSSPPIRQPYRTAASLTISRSLTAARTPKLFSAARTSTGRPRAALGPVADGTERDKENKVHAADPRGRQDIPLRVSVWLRRCAGPAQIIGNTARAVQQIDSSSDLLQRFFAGAAHPSEAVLRRVGRRALDKFIDSDAWAPPAAHRA